MSTVEVARWATPNGHHELRLFRDEPVIHGAGEYTYRATSGGRSHASGYLGLITLDGALAEMERRIALGCYVPDKNKRPMRRVVLYGLALVD